MFHWLCHVLHLVAHGRKRYNQTLHILGMQKHSIVMIGYHIITFYLALLIHTGRKKLQSSKNSFPTGVD